MEWDLGLVLVAFGWGGGGGGFCGYILQLAWKIVDFRGGRTGWWFSPGGVFMCLSLWDGRGGGRLFKIREILRNTLPKGKEGKRREKQGKEKVKTKKYMKVSCIQI